jgi:hypothetical protein
VTHLISLHAGSPWYAFLQSVLPRVEPVDASKDKGEIKSGDRCKTRENGSAQHTPPKALNRRVLQISQSTGENQEKW